MGTLEVQPPFFIGWFLSFTIILVGVYHHPKGTSIFLMVATTSRGIFFLNLELESQPTLNEWKW